VATRTAAPALAGGTGSCLSSSPRPRPCLPSAVTSNLSHLSPLPKTLLCSSPGPHHSEQAVGTTTPHISGSQPRLVLPCLLTGLAPLSNSQMRTGPLSDKTRVTKAAGGRVDLDLHLQVHCRCQTIFQASSKAPRYHYREKHPWIK